MQRTTATGPVNKLGSFPDYEYKIVIKYCTLNDLFNFFNDFRFIFDFRYEVFVQIIFSISRKYKSNGITNKKFSKNVNRTNVQT